METPLLRVSRPVSACSRCRNAKVKCDGLLPACTACVRANRAAECSSANDQFAKGKERSYVASLESRIERLENQIAQTKRRASSTPMPDFSFTPTVFSNNASKIGRRRSQRKEASEMDDLVSDFGFLSVNATARDFHGFTKQMSFARLVLSTSSADEMPRFARNAFPSQNATRELIQHCQKHVYALYPVLTDTALYGSLQAFYLQRDSDSLAIHRWNIRLTLAIALISQAKSKTDTNYHEAVRHVSGALEDVEKVIQPGSIAGVQAVLLLVLYSMYDPSHFKSWYLIGVASRIMVDLGLHQEPPEELRIKESQQELRRRIFYCVYSLDRTISIAHLRSFSFGDDSTNVEPPSLSTNHSSAFEPRRRSSSQSVDAVEPSRQILELRRIESSWYQTLFQSNRDALAAPWQYRSNALGNMYSWLSSLPDSTPNALKRVYRLEVLCGNILLIWPPGTTVTLCAYGKALVFDYAVEYMKTLWMICESPHSFVYCTSYDVLRTMIVGERLLDVLQDSPSSIFDSMAPQAPPAPKGCVLLPPLQRRSPTENFTEAITSVMEMDQVIDILATKFSFVVKAKYELLRARSAVVRQNLRALQQQQDRSGQYGPQPPSLQAIHGVHSQSGITSSWDPRQNTTRYASY